MKRGDRMYYVKIGITCAICRETIELRHPDEKRFPICDDCLRTLREIITEYKLPEPYGGE